MAKNQEETTGVVLPEALVNQLRSIIGTPPVTAVPLYETLNNMTVGDTIYLKESRQSVASSVSRKKRDGTIPDSAEWTYQIGDVVFTGDDGSKDVETVLRVTRMK